MCPLFRGERLCLRVRPPLLGAGRTRGFVALASPQGLRFRQALRSRVGSANERSVNKKLTTPWRRIGGRLGAALSGKCADLLIDDGRGIQRRDAAVVVGRRHFDDVETDDVEGAEPA